MVEKNPNILKYYVLQFLLGLMFFTPIIVLFWQENGLSLTEIMVLQALFSIWIVLLEVPTGFFADVYGRKLTIVIASFAFVTGVIAYSIGSNFWHFLIAEIIWGTAISLMSGTDSAFVYDSLAEERREHLYKKVEGKSVALNMAAAGLSSVIGGFIGHYDYRATFFFMIPFFIAIIPIALSLREPERHAEVIEKNHMQRLCNIIHFALHKNKELKWLLLFASLILAFDSIGFWLYQPYMKLTGLDVYWFGLVFASFNIIAALSSYYAHEIERKLKKLIVLASLAIAMSTAFLLMGYFVFAFGFVFVFLLQFVRGISRPVINDYINSNIGDDKRATVLSLKNLLRRFLFAILSPFIGWFADVYSLTDAFKIAGVIVLVIGMFLIVFLKKAKLYKAS